MFPTLPPQPLFRTIAARIAIIFLVLRLAAAGIGQALQLDPVSSLAPSPIGVLWTWGAVVLALRIDLARRGELLLLANLGYSFRRVAAFAVLECLLLDAVIHAAV